MIVSIKANYWAIRSTLKISTMHYKIPLNKGGITSDTRVYVLINILIIIQSCFISQVCISFMCHISMCNIPYTVSGIYHHLSFSFSSTLLVLFYHLIFTFISWSVSSSHVSHFLSSSTLLALFYHLIFTFIS